MNEIYENIRRIAAEQGKTLRDIERNASLGKNSIYRWATTEPSEFSLLKVASCLKVTVSELRGTERGSGLAKLEAFSSPVGNLVQMPIVGAVRAGYNGLAVEDYSGEYRGITADSLRGYAPNECRLLRVRGSSMYPTILEGDTVLVHRQEDVDSGEIAVVFCEDGEATIKTVVKGNGYIELVPKNPEYQTRRYVNGNCNEIHIWGKVLTLFRDF